MQRETPRQGPYETLSNERPYDMLSSEKTPAVKTEHGAESAPHTHPRFRIDRATRKCTKRLNVLSEGELRVLDALAKWLGYGWAPRISKDEVRLSASVIAECARMHRTTVVVARASLVTRGILVQTSPAVEGQYIPATYRVAIEVLEDLLAKAGAPDSMAMTHQAKRDQDEPLVAEGYTGQSSTGTTPSSPQGQPPVVHRDTLSTSMLIGVGSPVGERAASAALPYGQSLPGGEEAPEQEAALVTTEELEPPAPPARLVTTVQEGPTGSPGRLAAGSYSAWVPEEASESGVRPKRAKKSPGKKDPRVAPAPLAARAALEVPSALPETSERVAPRPTSPVASRPLPARTQKEAPDAAPAPRTIPATPHVPVVWSGNGSGSAPPLSLEERDFLARYGAAKLEVRAAQSDLLARTGELFPPADATGLGDTSLGDACAAAFTKHFPRGYSVELACWEASRTLALRSAKEKHEVYEARRRAREAQEEAEEEARAERAHKKKRSA